ncbi:MAG TPA: 50S ribosomal protein L4 [Syntrophales bacterium]|nr:50S ribosomal protein L4 [Syntrophales bacterium]HQB29315.1 50S ribosomal protein L4 [Syntrophales bacterium]HQN77520.1 50S ribosomal protein L4 [Syntrophales bacterium]HQQ27525.1 50S ribosomal protein L4 [Syntrophales bacterium]
MALINVYDIDRNKVSEIEVSDEVFAAPVNDSVIYEVVKMQLANRRQGTASTKTRSEIRGGGKKPWRQKGSGRARSGTSRSPIWRKGGTVFGPHPRDYSYRVPRKVRRAALRSALSMKLKNDELLVIRDLPMEGIRTKRFQEILNRLDLKNVLIVLDQANDVLEKSSRNIRDVKMMRSEGINVFDLMKYRNLVLLEPSVKMIERALM